MDTLAELALHVRKEAALDLRREGELTGIEALRFTLLPTEDVLAASLEVAKRKLAAGSGLSLGKRATPRRALHSREAAPRREISWARR